MSTQQTNKAWPIVLGAFCAWDIYEDYQRQKHTNNYRPWPVPSERDRLYDGSSVSLVVPTQIECGESIKTALDTWLANKPSEIIFVTRDDKREELRSLLMHIDSGATIISIHTIPHWHKRDQLVVGINNCHGAIIALVDDDAFWKSDRTLLNLLAPFQDEDIGLVSGPIRSYVPDERRNPNVITPWEVAAFRIREKRDGAMKAAFAADGGTNFCVSGVTMLLRSEILKDKEFQDAFTRETWMGKRTNSGDDSFITRWVLFYEYLNHRMYRSDAGLLERRNGLLSEFPGINPMKKWKLGIQHTPESIVETSLHPNSKFAGQLKRWYRSGLRLRLTCLASEPGWYAMKTSTPYMARKMFEGMMSPVLSWLRLFAQLNAFRSSPRFAATIFSINAYLYYKDVTGFFQKFPWCKSRWWAPLISDRLYFFSDFYSWYTLSRESWETRPEVDMDITEEETRATGRSMRPSESGICGYSPASDTVQAGFAPISHIFIKPDIFELKVEQKAVSPSSSGSRVVMNEAAAASGNDNHDEVDQENIEPTDGRGDHAEDSERSSTTSPWADVMFRLDNKQDI